MKQSGLRENAFAARGSSLAVLRELAESGLREGHERAVGRLLDHRDAVAGDRRARARYADARVKTMYVLLASGSGGVAAAGAAAPARAISSSTISAGRTTIASL